MPPGQRTPQPFFGVVPRPQFQAPRRPFPHDNGHVHRTRAGNRVGNGKRNGPERLRPIELEPAVRQILLPVAVSCPESQPPQNQIVRNRAVSHDPYLSKPAFRPRRHPIRYVCPLVTNRDIRGDLCEGVAVVLKQFSDFSLIRLPARSGQRPAPSGDQRIHQTHAVPARIRRQKRQPDVGYDNRLTFFDPYADADKTGSVPVDDSVHNGFKIAQLPVSRQNPFDIGSKHGRIEPPHVDTRENLVPGVRAGEHQQLEISAGNRAITFERNSVDDGGIRILCGEGTGKNETDHDGDDSEENQASPSYSDAYWN